MKKQLLIIAASLALVPIGELFALQSNSLMSKNEILITKNLSHNPVSYTHLTLPTIYSV